MFLRMGIGDWGLGFGGFGVWGLGGGRQPPNPKHNNQNHKPQEKI